MVLFWPEEEEQERGANEEEERERDKDDDDNARPAAANGETRGLAAATTGAGRPGETAGAATRSSCGEGEARAGNKWKEDPRGRERARASGGTISGCRGRE
jgi:hypothetical protein